MAEKNYDESHLERRYFIDGQRYNCPYCNVRCIQYQIEDSGKFDWSRERECYFYTVRCTNCNYDSFHLSNYELLRDTQNSLHFQTPPYYVIRKDGARTAIPIKKNNEAALLDEAFFYHQPTNFFTVDNRIPGIIRNLISEADGCKKMAYLIGASGCLRKAIYELLAEQKIPKMIDNNELSYEKRIKQLKEKFPNIDAEYFDILASIQSMTSDSLHEGSWDSFDLPTFTLLLEATKEILYEIYVVPDEKKNKKSLIQQLRQSFNNNTKAAEARTETL